MNLPFKRLHPDAKMPVRGSKKAAGLDAFCVEDFVLNPGEDRLVKIGWAVQLPDGTELQVRSRSGIAKKFRVVVLNQPGTIDADYTGEIGVMLINHGANQFAAKKGDAIAQLVHAPVLMADAVEVEALEQTERGSGGFGSTSLPGA